MIDGLTRKDAREEDLTHILRTQNLLIIRTTVSIYAQNAGERSKNVTLSLRRLHTSLRARRAGKYEHIHERYNKIPN